MDTPAAELSAHGTHKDKTQQPPTPPALDLPGKNMPGYVPIGTKGVASDAQGNQKGLATSLKGAIIVAERNSNLTYPEVYAKYPQWGLSQSTLRGLYYKYNNKSKDDLARIKSWTFKSVDALKEGVRLHTGRQGKIPWRKVKEYVSATSDKNYGTQTLRAKWEQLKGIKPLSMAILDPVQPIVSRRIKKKQAMRKKQKKDGDDSDGEDDDDDKDDGDGEDDTQDEKQAGLKGDGEKDDGEKDGGEKIDGEKNDGEKGDGQQA